MSTSSHICLLVGVLVLMLAGRSPRVLPKVDDSTTRKELMVRMMLISAVSMPDDVSGASHRA